MRSFSSKLFSQKQSNDKSQIQNTQKLPPLNRLTYDSSLTSAEINILQRQVGNYATQKIIKNGISSNAPRKIQRSIDDLPSNIVIFVLKAAINQKLIQEDIEKLGENETEDREKLKRLAEDNNFKKAFELAQQNADSKNQEKLENYKDDISKVGMEIAKYYSPKEYVYLALGNSPVTFMGYLQLNFPESLLINMPLGDISTSHQEQIFGDDVQVPNNEWGDNVQNRQTYFNTDEEYNRRKDNDEAGDELGEEARLNDFVFASDARNKQDNLRRNVTSHFDKFVHPDLLGGRKKILLIDFAAAGRALEVGHNLLEKYYKEKDQGVTIDIYAVVGGRLESVSQNNMKKLRQAEGVSEKFVEALDGKVLKELGYILYDSYKIGELEKDEPAPPTPQLANYLHLLLKLQEMFK